MKSHKLKKSQMLALMDSFGSLNPAIRRVVDMFYPGDEIEVSEVELKMIAALSPDLERTLKILVPEAFGITPPELFDFDAEPLDAVINIADEDFGKYNGKALVVDLDWRPEIINRYGRKLITFTKRS